MKSQTMFHTLYKKLIDLYPVDFKDRLGESMQQTFNDLYREKQAEGKWMGFVLWMFVETTLGVVREHIRAITTGALMKTTPVNLGFAALLSSILLAMAFIIAPWIYLVGNLEDARGPFFYALADFLSGPVWAASLVSMVFVLRERIGKQTPHRMSLAPLAAILAAGTMILIACIRSANRNYHLLHPELHLEESSTVLIVWNTLISGLTGAGWHFLGWAMILIGSAGWSSRQLPSLLTVLYMAAGIASLFVYLLPVNEGLVILLGVVISIWQGILLWKAAPEEIPTSRQDQAWK